MPLKGTCRSSTLCLSVNLTHVLLKFVYCIEESDLGKGQDKDHPSKVFGLASSSASPGLGLGALDWATDWIEGARLGGMLRRMSWSVCKLVESRAFSKSRKRRGAELSKKRAEYK